MPTIILTILLLMPGQNPDKPSRLQEEMTSLQDCLDFAIDVLRRGEAKGQRVMAACEVIPPEPKGA